MKLLGKRENEWQTWLKRRAQAQSAYLNCSDRKARAEADSLNHKAVQVCSEAVELMGIQASWPYPPEKRGRIREHMAREAQYLADRGESYTSKQLRDLLARLDEAEAQYSAAREKVKSLADKKVRLRSEMEEVAANPPKSSRKALESIDEALKKNAAEKKRVTQAMEKLGDSEGAIGHAQRKMEDAQEHLDTLSAAAAMGDDAPDQRSATTGLAKARAELTKAQEEADRQDSARRGLERKSAQLDEQAEELGSLRSEVLIELSKMEMAEAEGQLIELLTNPAIKDTVEHLNRLKRQYAKAQTDSEDDPLRTHRHSLGRVEIEINSLLQFHPDAKTYSGGIKI